MMSPLPNGDVKVIEPFHNGLRVLLHEDHAQPIVAMQVIIHGGATAQNNASGVAHLLEHTSFVRTANYQDFFSPQFELELAGGQLNAVTSRDTIRYKGIVSSHNVDALVTVLSEIVLSPQLTETDCNNERPIIQTEIMRSYENPVAELIDNAYAQTYHSHPYKYSPLGSPADIAAVSLKELKAFQRTWFVPNNISIVFVGDITPSQVIALLEKSFGAAKPGSLPAWPAREQAETGAMVTAHLYKPLTTTYQAMVFQAPSDSRISAIASTDLAITLLADGPDALLPHVWLRDGISVHRFGVEYVPLRSQGRICIWAETSPDVADKLRISTLRFLQQVSGSFIDPAHIVAAKQRLTTQFVMENQSYVQQADTIAFYEGLGDGLLACSYLPTLQSISDTQIRNAIPVRCLAWVTLGMTPKG